MCRRNRNQRPTLVGGGGGGWTTTPSTVIEGTGASARPMKTLAITRRKVKPMLSLLRGEVSCFESAASETQPSLRRLIRPLGAKCHSNVVVFLLLFFSLFFFGFFPPPSCRFDSAHPSISHYCTQTIRSPADVFARQLLILPFLQMYGEWRECRSRIRSEARGGFIGATCVSRKGQLG